MKVLVCGDSYCVTDPNYPNLHWTEKMLAQSGTIELCNLAHGGCSNAMIVLQLLQGMSLQPAFVILSFTEHGRYELDNDITALPQDLTCQELAHYQKQRYTVNSYEKDRVKLDVVNRWRTLAASENFEKIKNYFYISFCLTYLKSHDIPYCFSLGGFEYQQDHTLLLSQNYVENLLIEHAPNQLFTNLWQHGHKKQPVFHVDDERAQFLFANECMARIRNLCDNV